MTEFTIGTIEPFLGNQFLHFIVGRLPVGSGEQNEVGEIGLGVGQFVKPVSLLHHLALLVLQLDDDGLTVNVVRIGGRAMIATPIFPTGAELLGDNIDTHNLQSTIGVAPGINHIQFDETPPFKVGNVNLHNACCIGLLKSNQIACQYEKKVRELAGKLDTGG